MPNSDNPNLPNITSTNSLFCLEKVKSNSLIISVINNGLKFKMVAPYQTFDSIHTKSVSSNHKTGLCMYTLCSVSSVFFAFCLTKLDISCTNTGKVKYFLVKVKAKVLVLTTTLFLTACMRHAAVLHFSFFSSVSFRIKFAYSITCHH